jgi:predicted DNA binding CopG/RHH family protein
MKRLTIKQQSEIARKSKSKLEELSKPEELPEPLPEDSKRDKQVNVKFSANDLVKLKKAASQSHRPVANYIYHLVMERVAKDVH